MAQHTGLFSLWTPSTGSEIVGVVPSRSRPDRKTVTVRSETLNQREIDSKD